MHHKKSNTSSKSGARRRCVRAAISLAATGAVALACVTPALASSGDHHRNDRRHHRPAVELVAVTPGPGDTAGAGGVFNVDLALLARNGAGNAELAAANGYTPGINSPGGSGFGIGKPDPFAPGLVVTLSTTPQAVGGPNANLAGVFQLTDVAQSNGLAQVFADWQVGKAGAFGQNSTTTLTAYLVKGTAPGIVTGAEKPISNVVSETFTIGG